MLNRHILSEHPRLALGSERRCCPLPSSLTMTLQSWNLEVGSMVASSMLSDSIGMAIRCQGRIGLLGGGR